jgi:hypothetical protein
MRLDARAVNLLSSLTHVHNPKKQINLIPARGGAPAAAYRGRATELHVVASAGFEFHERQIHGNTTRAKPGWWVFVGTGAYAHMYAFRAVVVVTATPASP